jgi:hypothetical protein
MVIFSISDYRWAIASLGFASQRRETGDVDAEQWQKRLTLAKFAIANMPDKLIKAMIPVDYPISVPSSVTLVSGSADHFDFDSGMLHLDGQIIKLMGLSSFVKRADKMIIYSEALPDKYKESATLISELTLVMQSHDYEDGYFASGRLLFATWHIMDMIDWVDRKLTMPSPESEIRDFKNLPDLTPDQIQLFLSRLQTL